MKIKKTINGKALMEEGACKAELERFVRKFGLFYDLADIDVEWIADHEKDWLQYLEQHHFVDDEPEVTIAERTVARPTKSSIGEGPCASKDIKTKGEIRLSSFVAHSGEIWIDLIDAEGRHISPTNMIEIDYDKENKALRIVKRPCFECPGKLIESKHGYVKLMVDGKEV